MCTCRNFGLVNYWGYNSIGFFAPERDYLASNSIAEFKTGVTSLALYEPSIAYNDPFKAPVGASLLANNAGLPATARFASKLAPTQERTTGYAHSRPWLKS